MAHRLRSAATRLVRVCLGALTRVEWSAVVEVPRNITEDQRTALADQFYEDVDGGDYLPDDHFWDRGESSVEPVQANDSEPPRYRVRIVDGAYVVDAINGSSFTGPPARMRAFDRLTTRQQQLLCMALYYARANREDMNDALETLEGEAGMVEVAGEVVPTAGEEELHELLSLLGDD